MAIKDLSPAGSSKAISKIFLLTLTTTPLPKISWFTRSPTFQSSTLLSPINSALDTVCNQEDLAFERIINTPARGIGKKTLENIQLVALNHQISLYDALTLHSDEIRLSNKSKKEVRILVEAIEKARRSTLPLHEMFENLMIDVGYIEMLKNDLEDNRIDNIHELQRSIYDFQVSHEDAPTLENYLQDISLYTDNDAIDQGQYVSL